MTSENIRFSRWFVLNFEVFCYSQLRVSRKNLLHFILKVIAQFLNKILLRHNTILVWVWFDAGFVYWLGSVV